MPLTRTSGFATVKAMSPEFPRQMPLLDDESRAHLPPLYSTEKLGDAALARVKFFTPDAGWTCAAWRR